MVKITVKEFAKKIGCDTKRLLFKLTNAGVKYKNAENLLTEKDKQNLLNYLFYQQGITNFYFTRKRNSKLHMENKNIDIQICNKHTCLNLNTDKDNIDLTNSDNRIYNINTKQQLINNIHTFKTHNKFIIREINIYESNSLLFIAKKMAIKAAYLIKVLLRMGFLVTINQKICKDIACLVVEELGHIPKNINVNEVEDFLLKNLNNTIKTKTQPITKTKHINIKTKTQPITKTKHINIKTKTLTKTKNINIKTKTKTQNIIINNTNIQTKNFTKTQTIDKQINKHHNNNNKHKNTEYIATNNTNHHCNINTNYKTTNIHNKHYNIKAKTINTVSVGSVFKRCPIITVMGHVDHGKTSLIDCIRNSNLVKKEIGGITQYIDVYHVYLDQGKNNITIIDTPGHKAFRNMRQKGVSFTDIVILVVSADDGIKPQTIEAIEHTKVSNLPVIVAINKMDKIGTDIDRVRNQLSKYGIIPEEWGGKTPFIPVSAKTGLGIELLLESVLLLSELIDLTTVLDSPGKGVVIESRMDIGKGPVAKILVLNGTLNKGDIVVCGLHYGRVRAISNHLGNIVEQIGPSIPADIFGFNGVPESGEPFNVVSDERKAREVVNIRSIKSINNKQQTNLIKNCFKKTKTLNIVLKVDVQGTLHALRTSINELSNDQIILNIISASVGNLNSNDVNLAITSKAILIGFNVQVVSKARDLIEREHIHFFYYKLIYNFIDGLNEIIHKALKPKKLEQVIGIAEIRDIFKTNKKNGIIIGCIVKKGSVVRNKKLRILRNNEIVFKGDLYSLRRFKKDVNEVCTGLEFGICIRDFNDVQVGDTIEFF